MSNNFRVGQKVVCVHDILGVPDWWAPLHYGRIYTVRETFISPSIGRCSVRLEEITNSFHPVWECECGYVASLFRPAVERKADISIFTRMLTNNKVTA